MKLKRRSSTTTKRWCWSSKQTQRRMMLPSSIKPNLLLLLNAVKRLRLCSFYVSLSTTRKSWTTRELYLLSNQTLESKCACKLSLNSSVPGTSVLKSSINSVRKPSIVASRNSLFLLPLNKKSQRTSSPWCAPICESKQCLRSLTITIFFIKEDLWTSKHVFIFRIFLIVFLHDALIFSPSISFLTINMH